MDGPRRGGRTAELLRVARHPTLRRIGAGFGLFAIAEYATWIAVTVYAFARGGVGEAGVVAVVQLVPAMLIAPFAAYAGDRFRADRVLALGYVVQSVAMLATALAMWRNAPALLVYILATVVAVAVTFTRPTLGALLPAATATPADLTAANVSLGVFEHLGAFAGPALAGLLLRGSGGSARVFAVMGVGLAIAAFAASRLRVERAMVLPQAEINAGDVVHEVFGGFRTLRQEPDLRVLVISLGVRTTIVGACDVLFVAVADELFDERVAAARAGLLAAGFGLGALLAAVGSVVFVGQSRLAAPHTLAVIVSGAALGLLAGLSQPGLVFGLFMVAGAGESVARITGTTLVQRIAPSAVLSRVFGVMEGLDMAALAIGSLGVSILVTELGLAPTLAALGIALVLAATLGAPRLRRVDSAVPAPRPELVRLVRAQDLFAGLPSPELARLLAAIVPVEVAPGAVVIRQGEPGDRYYLVERGELAVTVDGRPVRTVGPGDDFGEVALVRDVPRTATVTAVSPALLHAIERDEFLTALTGHPRGLGTAAERAQRILDGDAARRPPTISDAP
jgi:hypothetical protein